MAELNENSEKQAAKPRRIRARKLNSRVDLTAMVDLAFLLITFFMLTTSLSKPHSMALSMPDNENTTMNVDENATLTVLIGENDTMWTYRGKYGQQRPEATSAGKKLRAVLAESKTQALDYGKHSGKEGGLFVIIKPSRKSNFKSLVDVLDEMAISDVQRYAITDITEKEAQFVAQ